jgi:hydroxymethylbilane synthase
MVLRLGTRGSALALAQTELTRVALSRAQPDLAIDVQTFVTRGDRKLDANALPSGEAGVKGLFTKELEDALLAGTIDVAVHSLKDLPGRLTPGLYLPAVLERADTADVLLTRDGTSFETLPRGARIATSSVRRAHQLSALRPDLVVPELRGNVPTRLRKLVQTESLAGIVLAQAGLDRLGYRSAKGRFEFEGTIVHAESLAARMLPAIGQGAVALEIRSGRDDVAEILRAINHLPTFCAIEAERELQRLLGGDCALPVGVRTTINNDQLAMEAILFSSRDPLKPLRARAAGHRDQRLAIAHEIFTQFSPALNAAVPN